jgi:hypothetical protein
MADTGKSKERGRGRKKYQFNHASGNVIYINLW